MSEPIEVHLPAMPECWDSCGNCSDAAVLVSEILVRPGERIERDDPVITLETDKTTLDIPTPCAGRVTALHIDIGDAISEGMLILTLQPD
ncbi:lipoyl domain-containing protein [Sedimenticola selenatireducens]|uniref:Dihydrolipoamide acyltransferase n=1 Tax=Sedimenticola selenatireducens TaxID=191960 RepID=A0A2N6CZN0_9GAMM|nr:lipoyl domain-containing protein [Sedimenticola selenatireducens]PLX62849.1 MAG: dihydrolipoamide acyltransferase [Sedimenticola selenatireducens]